MNRISAGSKLVAGFGILLVLLVGVSVSGGSKIRNYSSKLNELEEIGAKRQGLVHGAEISLEKMWSAQRGFILDSFGKNRKAVNATRQSFETSLASAQNEMAALGPMISSPKQHRLVEEINSGLNDWKTLFGQIDALCAVNNQMAAYRLIVDKPSRIHGAILSSMSALSSETQVDLVSARTDAVAAGNISGVWPVIQFMAALLGIGILWSVFRSIRAALRVASQEVGADLKTLNNTAARIANSSQALASNNAQQVRTLNAKADESVDIVVLTKKNLGSVERVAKLMAEVDSNVVESNRYLAEMVRSMDEITDSSGRIKKIIKVIDGIAFQTNILALNASVEAARAGEAGLGFAVVADEVRNLAQRCAQAARDTTDLIEESITRSANGKVKLDQVTTSIHKITAGAKAARGIMDQVNSDTRTQEQSLERISNSFATLREHSSFVALNSSESFESCTGLNEAAQRIENVLAAFRNVVLGAEYSIANPDTSPTRESDAVLKPALEIAKASATKKRARELTRRERQRKGIQVSALRSEQKLLGASELSIATGVCLPMSNVARP